MKENEKNDTKSLDMLCDSLLCILLYSPGGEDERQARAWRVRGVRPQRQRVTVTEPQTSCPDRALNTTPACNDGASTRERRAAESRVGLENRWEPISSSMRIELLIALGCGGRRLRILGRDSRQSTHHNHVLEKPTQNDGLTPLQLEQHL
ncbi:hypothetical protein Q8A73_014194 [Channa argus]|nr:hypothetical protein Q8A73_014194 [Channa argus]